MVYFLLVCEVSHIVCNHWMEGGSTINSRKEMGRTGTFCLDRENRREGKKIWKGAFLHKK